MVRAVQGDAAALLDVVPPGSADLVLCHGVLEQVDDLGPAVAALVAVLRPGGTLSLLVASRNAVVLARAVAGRFDEARHALDDPDGRWGPRDPLPRRFTEPGLAALLADAGLRVVAVHGVRTVADLVPGALVDHDPGAAEALRRPRDRDRGPAGVPGGRDPAARPGRPALSGRVEAGG